DPATAMQVLLNPCAAVPMIWDRSFDIFLTFALSLYRGCQKNVPIEDRFSATNPYVAILFSEHYYDKRYKIVETILFYATLSLFLRPKNFLISLN
ncbi:MAG: hypothetical protein QNK29_04830, partial [Desulfobacterales bacterium]|nr:hypothetical protein [Desulfobacterales bacterium]MDX2511287.1 hypothetical protein [Desulfobacterales bacterium]